MEEKVIGLVYRFGKNDYQLNIMDFDERDQIALMTMMEKYEDDCSCERGDSIYLNLFRANIEYWERVVWAKQEMETKRKALAQKLWNIGFIKSDILYDNQADEQLTEKQIDDVLKNKKDTTYLLETFLQFCDGSQEEEDHKLLFDAAMEIVHYLENMEGEN